TPKQLREAIQNLTGILRAMYLAERDTQLLSVCRKRPIRLHRLPACRAWTAIAAAKPAEIRWFSGK
ncbi:MAG TPA: hypothetical protein VGC79_13935, partial [Polyangiaceae bacterium]